jgi:hypothetical protein
MSQPTRVYGNYYSKACNLSLDGEIIAREKNNKVVFRPFRRTIGNMIVPLAMFNHVVVVNDSGLVNSY